jgi:hypothetical protein
MQWVRWLVFGLIVASLGGGLDASKENGPGKSVQSHGGKARPRGNQKGDYILTVTGGFQGGGKATVDTNVALLVKVSDKDGKSGMLVANNLPVTQGYFTGKGTIMGAACTVYGRVDLASATDVEETDLQATTARITGTFKTDDGKVGRLVAVQKH